MATGYGDNTYGTGSYGTRSAGDITVAVTQGTATAAGSVVPVLVTTPAAFGAATAAGTAVTVAVDSTASTVTGSATAAGSPVSPVITPDVPPAGPPVTGQITRWAGEGGKTPPRIFDATALTRQGFAYASGTTVIARIDEPWRLEEDDVYVLLTI